MIKKDVPYFQCYAANFLANREFRLMNLDERGLLISIYMECWVNGSVPSDPSDLAKCLGFKVQEVSNSLTPHVRHFLLECNDSFTSPELDGYKKNFLEGRLKQSEGGKEGARRKKEKILGKVEELDSIGEPLGVLEGQPKGSLSYINSASIKSNSLNPNQLIKKGEMSEENKAWVNDYEDALDVSNDYQKASRG